MNVKEKEAKVHPRRPNVIVVFGDQWRAQATGYGGDPNVQTPNLDRFAAESVNCVNAVSGCPVCAPWRASLLTGLYPLNHGLIVNDVPLDPALPAAGDIFRDAGYDTGYIGKWHVDGHGRGTFIPRGRRHGFDYWKVLECTHDYNHSEYFGDAPERKVWEGYDAIAQTRDAMDFIDGRGERPFCLFLSWGPPHAPYATAPEAYRARFKADDVQLRGNVPEDVAESARRDLAGYYAHIAALDDCLGELLRHLEDNGLAADTLVLFTSDHGDMIGSQGARKKQQPFDESIRVPFLARCPALGLANGKELNAPIDAPDILPTLLGLCGIQTDVRFDGLDYSNYLRGGDDPGDGSALLSCFVPFGQWPREIGGREYRGIRDERFTYVEDLTGPWLLFDNAADPFQMNNLAAVADFIDERERLGALLKRKLENFGDDFIDSITLMRNLGYYFNHEKIEFRNHINIRYDIGSVRSRWVYPGQRADVNSFMRFRHDFAVETVDPEATLHVSADSDYAAWLNGTFIGHGQFSDYPDAKTYDSLPVGHLLREGDNSLRIQHYWKGIDCSTSREGESGLIYALVNGETVIASGEDTLWQPETGYRQGDMARVSPQLGFSFEYDGAAAGDWLDESDDLNGWNRIVQDDCCVRKQIRPLAPRPVKKCVLGAPVVGKVIAQGVFHRTVNDKAPAEMMWNDSLAPALPSALFDVDDPDVPIMLDSSSERSMQFKIDAVPDDADGVYFVIDLGRETCGLPLLELEAEAGTVVEIAYGQHLEDLRVRSFIAGRHFGTRTVCHEGANAITHYFTRWSGRYLQVHVHRPTAAFKLCYVGLIPCDYPVERTGRIELDDQLHRQIHETAIHTLRLCMHEHYEDTPWREQALYANDARIQALCGYYCFDGYEFPAASIDLLARSLADDGWLELCAPAVARITIPSFTFAWVLMARDFLLYRGAPDGRVAEWFEVVKAIVSRRLDEMEDGLLPLPFGERFWHFHDWKPGVDGLVPGKGFALRAAMSSEYEAPLNFLFILVLEAGVEFANHFGDASFAETCETVADRCRKAAWDAFWDADREAFRFSNIDAGRDCFAELAQALAALAGVAGDDDRREALLDRLASDSNGWVATTLSQSFFKFEALLTDKEKYGKRVFDMIAETWGAMLRAGATSFWETAEGASAFHRAGSLCHGWSASPAYFHFSALAGVKPTKPGFAKHVVEPVPGEAVRATIPTPNGKLSVNSKQA